MLRVGITGGTASGKSTVARMFAAKPCVHSIDADALVHELYAHPSALTRKIAETFGGAALNSDGSVNRVALGEIVFRDAAKLQKLEQIVHPAVIQREHELIDAIEKQDPAGIALVEASKMFEAGSYKSYDRVILVTADADIQLDRFCRRQPGLPLDDARAEFARRVAAQWSDAERRSAVPAESVIDNSGPLEETAAQVDRIYAELLAQAAAKTAGHPKS